MKIRIVLFTAIATLLFVSCTTMEKKCEIQKKDIAIQLYSIRSLIGNPENNFSELLKDLSEMGYTAVEAAGYNNGEFYNLAPQDFKKEVELAGMKVLSSHCNKPLSEEELATGDYSESLKWWDITIQAHKEAGMSYIVKPWLDLPKTVKDLKTYCDYFNEIGKRCQTQGMKFGYHNHAQEFQKVEDQVVMLDYMLENTNPEYVFFELDVYWAVIGKVSPVDYFNKYPGRFEILHIKDQREIGQSGMVGFDAIFNNAETAGVNHIVVEVERYSGPVKESIKQSIDYLQNAPFVKASYSN